MREMEARRALRPRRPSWTTFARVDLIDADARIRLAMQACQALPSALLDVVRSEGMGQRDRMLASRPRAEAAPIGRLTLRR
jgi:hypothetical protein